MTEFIKRFQNLMPEECDCAVITSEENRIYFLGFAASNGTLVIGRKEAVFFTDSRYITAAQQAVSGADVVLQTESADKMLKAVFDKNGYRNIAFEATKISVSRADELKKNFSDKNLDFSGEIDSIILKKIRRYKTPEEVEKIKEAQKITEDAFTHICGYIKPGMTEKQVQLELDFYMLSHGADALSFETIVVAGENSAKPHGVPGQKVIENGEFVTMDFGAVKDFYHSDMTRTVCVGKADAEMKKVYDTVLRAQISAIKAAAAGEKCSVIDRCARDIIAGAGYAEYFGHGTGHGVGVEIHEQPCFSPSSTDMFSNGDVVTVEPGIYLPGKFGVRIEDMFYLYDGKTVNLTSSPKELIELQ